VQVDPLKSMLKPPGTKHVKLKCGILLSTFAFKSNLRRHIKAITVGLNRVRGREGSPGGGGGGGGDADSGGVSGGCGDRREGVAAEVDDAARDVGVGGLAPEGGMWTVPAGGGGGGGGGDTPDSIVGSTVTGRGSEEPAGAATPRHSNGGTRPPPAPRVSLSSTNSWLLNDAMAAAVAAGVASGRGLHSSTFRFNLSAFYGIGGARRGCVARLKGVFRVCRVLCCVRHGSS